MGDHCFEFLEMIGVNKNLKNSDSGEENREDRKCADLIKSVHAKLRAKAQTDSGNVEDIWDTHLEQGELKEYSEAMHQLATEHWEESPGFPRISWVKDHVDKFLFGGDRERLAEKIIKFGHRNCGEDLTFDRRDPERRRHLLDVGSCYNPFAQQFRKEERLDVTAIDLQPPQNTQDPVFKCDFYRVPLSDDIQSISDEGEVLALKRGSFDVVVFCLLLEYLPLPKMRHAICRRAREVMADWGVLLIVTPDSSHQAKNELQIKCWRLALLKMGHVRVYVEKLPHARCLGFMKVPENLQACHYVTENIAKLKQKLCPTHNWALPESDEDLMFIPQDETTRQKVLKDEENENKSPEIFDESLQVSCMNFLEEFAEL